MEEGDRGQACQARIGEMEEREALLANAMRYVFKKRRWRWLVPFADLLFSLFPKHKLSSPQEILVFRVDGIGDTLLTLPFIEAVFATFPDKRVSLCVPPECASLFAGHPRVHRLLTFKAPWYGKDGGEPLKKFISYLSLFGFDTAFDPRGDLRHILLLRKAGVRQIIGFGITGGGAFLSYCASYERGIPVGENYRRLLSPFGGSEGKPFTLYATEADRVFLKSLPVRFKGRARPFFVFHPFASTTAKQWPLSYWKELLRNLSRKREGTFFLLGGRRDEGAMHFIATPNTVLLPRVFTLREIFLLMKQCAGFVGVDSGMAHLSALADIPRVILFSGTNEKKEYAPSHTTNQRLLSVRAPCAPCELKVCPVRGHPCMSDLSVARVEREVLSWFR